MPSARSLLVGSLLALCIPSLAAAQTIISGNVFDGNGGPLVPAGSPYLVPAFSTVTVPASRTLTVQPGVEVRLAENAYVEVYGTLTSVAAVLSPIRYTTHIAGQYWFALIVRSGGNATLRQCDVEYGGRGGNAMVTLQDAATATIDQTRLILSQGDGLQGNIGQTGPGILTVTDCRISDNAGHGLNLLRGPFGTLTLSDNNLTNNLRAAFRLGPNIYPTGGTVSGNGFDGIDLVGGTTTISGTYAHDLLINEFAPIAVGVGTTLTLNPGIDVRLRRVGTYFEVYGTLKAEGTAVDRIRFTNHVPGENWQSLIFRTSSSGSLDQCDLEYGGSAMLAVQEATDLKIARSTLRFAQGDAISGFVGSSVPSSLAVTKCTIANNGLNGFNLTRGPSGTITLADNAVEDNGASAYRLSPDIYPTGGSEVGNLFNGIDLVGGAVTVSGTYEHDLLFNAFAPLLVPAGVTLTIAPGVDVRFMQGATYLDVSGRLQAESMPGDFIRFMPHDPSKPWQAVILRAGSSGSFRYCDFTGGGSDMLVCQDATDVVIDHSIIRHSKSGGLQALVGQSIAGSFSMTNCIVANNIGWGCHVRSGPSATASLTCNTFAFNGGDGLMLQGGNPVVGSNAFFSNTGGGLSNIGPSSIDARNNWWGDASGPGGIGPGTGDEILNTGGGSVLFAPWAAAWSFPGCGPVLDADLPRPATIALHPCSPNPVRRLTSIRFALPRAALVQLRVYDVSGRIVATIADGWREAGPSTLTFDASGLESGVYFCRLQVGAFRAIQRFVRVE